MQQDTILRCVRPVVDISQKLAEHERLVHWVVHRQWLGELSYAAAVQAGRLGLWRAVVGYEAQRGTAFSSYAVPAIQRAVWRAVRQASPDEQCCPRLPQPSLDPEQEVLRRGLAGLVGEAVSRLPKRLADVIIAHYGLGDQAAQSFARIGQALGVSRQRVQQLHVEALLWLAQPGHSLALRLWLQRNTRCDYRAYLARQRQWLRHRRAR